MKIEILTPDEMARADRLAIEQGPFDGVALMRRAGAAVADNVMLRYPQTRHVNVLCGPGNNGGDGYVAATLLARSGVEVSLWSEGLPRAGSDAEFVAKECPLQARDLSDFEPCGDSLVIDALYGAGLARPLEGAALSAVEKVAAAGQTVVAVDLPSGISGESGEALGAAFRAALTVTFARKKPGHLLYPGRALCGEVILCDIGISDAVVEHIGGRCFENSPSLWLSHFPKPAEDTYKYSRGHVGVFSGGVASTGASRLSAIAAARTGAGAVTLLSPPAALTVNAAHLTSIILRKVTDTQDVAGFIQDRKPATLVMGPGFGVSEKATAMLREIALAGSHMVVLDADALTMIVHQAEQLFSAFSMRKELAAVLTPHEGEFRRLFPDIHSDTTLSKLAKARKAAKRASAVVVYKGPDTVIAAPNGRSAINTNGTPLLATAGSGDVLSGIIAGLAAQRMPAFEAACAAVWMHAEAAQKFGPGLIAEDLPGMLPSVLKELLSQPVP